MTSKIFDGYGQNNGFVYALTPDEVDLSSSSDVAYTDLEPTNVPVSAQAVLLAVTLTDSAGAASVFFRPAGSDWAPPSTHPYAPRLTLAGAGTVRGQLIVPLVDGVCEYRLDASGSGTGGLNIATLGYFTG